MKPLPLILQKLQSLEFPHKLGILDRIYGKSLSDRGVCWINTAVGIPWKLDLTNVTHRWIVYGMYEGPGFIKWASGYLPDHGVIVDSGANIGQMALYLSQFIPKGKLFAFEPHAEALAWLLECLAHNPQLSVTCVPSGLGATGGTAFLQSPGDANLHGSWSQVSDTGGIPIKLVRLDDFFNEQQVKKLHLWKLDMEGYELQALQGAENLLQQHSIKAIYAELGFGNGNRIRDYLNGHGYECYFIRNNGKIYPAGNLPEHINALFLPE